jgi:transposase-like protein
MAGRENADGADLHQTGAPLTMDAQFTAEEKAAIFEQLARIEGLLRNPGMIVETSPAVGDVLTTKQAAALANCVSEHAFYRWAKRWNVKASAQGRWARLAIVHGLQRESRSRVEGRAVQQQRRRAA